MDVVSAEAKPQQAELKRMRRGRILAEAEFAERLLTFCTTTPTLFQTKAMKALLKRLRPKPDLVDQMFLSLQSKGKTPTSCITFPRTRDGRIQIDVSKHSPSELYARLFRFPDLQRKQLEPATFCLFGHDKSEMFCVNPYHYVRVVNREQRKKPKISLSNPAARKKRSTPPLSNDCSTSSAASSKDVAVKIKAVRMKSPKMSFNERVKRHRSARSQDPRSMRSAVIDPSEIIGSQAFHLTFHLERLIQAVPYSPGINIDEAYQNE